MKTKMLRKNLMGNKYDAKTVLTAASISELDANVSAENEQRVRVNKAKIERYFLITSITNKLVRSLNKMNITKKQIKGKLLMVMLVPLLTSCATYKSGFACGDAKGANCTSMDRVDRMISSGEIDSFNSAVKKCRGRMCRKGAAAEQMFLEQSTDNAIAIHFVKSDERRSYAGY